MIEHKISYLEAKNLSDSSFSGLISNNRFEILSNSDKEFPKLTNSSEVSTSPYFKPLRPHLQKPKSFSQPSCSTSSTEYSANKKRKVSSPTSEDPTPYLIPFRFGPSQPLPPLNKESFPNTDNDKNKLVDSLVLLFSSFIQNINCLEEAKSLDMNLLAKGINNVLDNILKNNSSNDEQI